MKGTWRSLLLVALAWSGDGLGDTLLVVRKSADALDFVDPGSGLRLASVPVGGAPHEVSVAPDGKQAAVSNYGTRERPGSSISIVDLQQPREIRRVDLAPHSRPHGIDWFRPDRIAVTTEGSSHLLVIDAATGRVVSALPTQQDIPHMVTVTPGGDRAYVANIGSGSVTAFSDVAGTAPVTRSVTTGAGTEGIAVTPDGREVWVAARGAGQVRVLDARTLEQLAQFAVPGTPIRIVFAPDGSSAYVSCAGSSEVIAFDTSSRRERARRRIDLPLAPTAADRPFAALAPGSVLPVGLAVSRDGRSVFVAATMADSIVQLDARSLEVLQVIDIDGEPDGMALTPVLPRAECHACSDSAVEATTQADP